MLNFVINDYIYHVCKVPVIFCQRYILFSGNKHQVYKVIAKNKSDLISWI